MKPAGPARLAAPLLALAAGAAFGLVLPRGPQSGPAVVAVVLVALALGVLLGHPSLLGPPALLGAPTGRPTPRWPLPLLAWLASEVVRWPVGEHLPDLVARAVGGSTYAVGVLALGRGVDLLVGLLPFAVGLALWRRHPDAAPRATRPPVALAGLVAVASLASLTPASTPATPGAPGNLAEVATVRIGGCDHRLVVRGAPGRPVVFFLSGGPGGTEVGTLRNRWAAVEREFTVVVWDQTGAGLNGRCFPRDGRLTLAGVRSDAADALRWVNARFGRRPLVVGNSWGTFLGVLLVRDHPDLVSAFVGTGQMVDLTATDAAFYDDTLAWAATAGRPDVAAALRAQGPPPYASMYPYEQAFAHEGDWNPWPRDPDVAAAVNPLANVLDKPELDPVAKLRYVVNLIDTFSVLYPQAQGIDLRTEARELAVPVYLAQGVHEARGRQQYARDWFTVLVAPYKEWVDFGRSGHKALGEEPDAFLALLRRAA